MVMFVFIMRNNLHHSIEALDTPASRRQSCKGFIDSPMGLFLCIDSVLNEIVINSLQIQREYCMTMVHCV